MNKRQQKKINKKFVKVAIAHAVMMRYKMNRIQLSIANIDNVNKESILNEFDKNRTKHVQIF